MMIWGEQAWCCMEMMSFLAMPAAMITLGAGFWVGGVSDGTTLWFIDANTPDTAFAYNASTRARDASRDITLGASNWGGGCL